MALLALLATIGLADGRAARAQQPPRSRVTTCGGFARPDRDGRFVAQEDLAPPTPPVDGDDLLALVNRSPRWTLGAAYAPRDLVDMRTMRPLPASQCVPPHHQCLRASAAGALRRLMDAMAREGEPAWIDSAYRGYAVQCMVFRGWAAGHTEGFCGAAAQSALPGHSQHQLGTAVDLFARSWVQGGARFREGFGCSRGGRWLAAHAWEHGFVLPYTLHPDFRAPGSDCAPRSELSDRADPRTGYKYEPWHLRFIGVDQAAAYHAAWEASAPGTAGEITLEQWLRARAGLGDPIEPATCDGCACAGCATFHAPGAGAAGPCARAGLTLDARGAPVVPVGTPTLIDARAERRAGVLRITVQVDVPANTLTQPPLAHALGAATFGPGRTIQSLVVVPGGVAHAYPPLPDAWRVAVAPAGDVARPWRAGLVEPSRDGGANGLNARIPAAQGRVEVVFAIEGVAQGSPLEVTLMRGPDVATRRALRAP